MASDSSVEQIELQIRTRELKELLASAYGSFDEAKEGNGWKLESLGEETLLGLKPISPENAEQIAEAKKTNLFGGLFGHPKPQDVKLAEKSLVYQPYWLIKGVHTLYYFRKASYRMKVADDVAGVSVNGRTEHVISGDKPGGGFSLTKGLSAVKKAVTGNDQHIEIADVTELSRLA